MNAAIGSRRHLRPNEAASWGLSFYGPGQTSQSSRDAARRPDTSTANASWRLSMQRQRSVLLAHQHSTACSLISARPPGVQPGQIQALNQNGNSWLRPLPPPLHLQREVPPASSVLRRSVTTDFKLPSLAQKGFFHTRRKTENSSLRLCTLNRVP